METPLTARCRYCARPLTDPLSIARGVGPVCAESTAAMTLELFDQPRTLAEVLREDFATSLAKLAADPPDVDDAIRLCQLLAAELQELTQSRP